MTDNYPTIDLSNPVTIDLDTAAGNAFAIIGAVSRRMLKDGRPPERIALFRRFYVDLGYDGLLQAAAHFTHCRFMRNGELLCDDDMP